LLSETIRSNAVRHGLTAETVIDALEDAGDSTAFEMAVTADYDAHSAVERELVLRPAGLLWRLAPRHRDRERSAFKLFRTGRLGSSPAMTETHR
jgi:hypothetical protein